MSAKLAQGQRSRTNGSNHFYPAHFIKIQKTHQMSKKIILIDVQSYNE